MRFVRPAESWSDQNLVVSQVGDKLYFISTKNINPRQELKVGYSEDYAKTRGLTVLSSTEDNQTSSFKGT